MHMDGKRVGRSTMMLFFWWEEYILAQELGNILSDFVMYLAMTIADQKIKQLRSKIPSQIGTFLT